MCGDLVLLEMFRIIVSDDKGRFQFNSDNCRKSVKLFGDGDLGKGLKIGVPVWGTTCPLGKDSHTQARGRLRNYHIFLLRDRDITLVFLD